MQFLDIPGTCPCCGYKTEVRQDPTSGVYTLWCCNPECSAKGNKKLEHFVKRDCMNIDGISGATLETLVDAGIVTDFTSIYHIKDHRSEIINLDGFGEQSFYKMVQAIEKSRDVQLHNLIFALGIPNIGLATAKLICENFNYDVVCCCVDCGQGKELDGLDQRAMLSGASKLYIEDINDDFAENFIMPCVQAGAVYEHKYLLGTSMARPAIVKKLVEIARKEGAVAICHGSSAVPEPPANCTSSFVPSPAGSVAS